jgi:hypothetical protein
MKAKLVGSVPSGDWVYEIKFDGYRALALRGGSEARIPFAEPKGPGRRWTKRAAHPFSYCSHSTWDRSGHQ